MKKPRAVIPKRAETAAKLFNQCADYTTIKKEKNPRSLISNSSSLFAK